jgi:cytochrome c peroxidase
MKKIKISIFMVLFATIVIVSCKDDEQQLVDDQVTHDTTPYNLDYGTFAAPAIPADNPITVQGALLGKMLFYDKGLSGDGSLACAGCHRQEDAFSDTAKFSTGIQGKQGGRQAMAIFNMLWHENEFFWDGRAHLLRDQSILPIQDALEMDETLENVVAKLSAKQVYRDQFMRAFGSEEITSVKISHALEQFMNTIISNKSKYDKYLAGNAQLSASELRGKNLFFAEYNEFFPEKSGADCAHCHSGDNFQNNQYMNNGLDAEADFSDMGRGKVTEESRDNAKFKVTSLRNIELTPPYMHDGRFSSLEEVVDHYNENLNASSTLDPALNATRNTGLMLDSTEKADLVAFLKTLTDETLKNNADYMSPF